MNIAVCDDNDEFIELIEKYIGKITEYNIEYDIYNSGEDLLYAYENNSECYDAIFLDMEMKKLDGIETGNRIRNIDKNIIIVFITSHSKYMQKSFECMPFRFIIKPVIFEDFRLLLDEVNKKLDNDSCTFVFKYKGDIIRLFCNDIILFESDSHFVNIVTASATYKLRTSINDLIKNIDNNKFVRAHRAYIVNLNHVYKIKDNEIILHNYDGFIPLSRNNKNDFKEKFLKFKERRYMI